MFLIIDDFSEIDLVYSVFSCWLMTQTVSHDISFKEILSIVLPIAIGRSSHRRCSVKNVFLEISRKSQENTCARVSFLIKLQA